MLESNLWGRIPDALRSRGATVLFGNQDSLGTVRSNADQLEDALREALALSGAPQVHVVAHSKGGLDARCLAHRASMAGRIASITTLATPHGGLHTCNRLLQLPAPVLESAAAALDGAARLSGDKRPDLLGVLSDLSATCAPLFDEAFPDVPGIAYRSYGVAPQPVRRLPNGIWAHWFIGRYDGENDGLVPLRSTEREPWTVIEAAEGAPGLNHEDVIDQRRKNIPVTVPGGRRFETIVGFHVELAEELASGEGRRASGS